MNIVELSLGDELREGAKKWYIDRLKYLREENRRLLEKLKEEDLSRFIDIPMGKFVPILPPCGANKKKN